MAFSGGTYTLPGAALNTGDTVSATENNTFRNDVATAFNLTMLRNGTSTATANLPMGGYKLTGLGNGTSSGDSLAYGQTADAVIYGLTVGRGAGSVSTNTAVGASALATVSSSAHTTAVGNAALNLIASNGYATAVGSNALSKATGANNTALGAYAGQNTTTGADNLFLGEESAVANTTGSYNVAVGRTALYSNTTASNNTAVGYQAAYSQQTGIDTTAVGYRALYTATGLRNTAVGKEALFSLTTGTNNTAIGESSGYSITTGSKNVIIGTYSGNQGGLDIRTSSNYIVLSDGDGNPAAWASSGGGVWNFGLGGTGSGNNGRINLLGASGAGTGPITYGYANGTEVWSCGSNSNYSGSTDNTTYRVRAGTTNGVVLTSGNTAWASASDERLKDIIEPITDAVAKVASIRAVIGKYKTDDEGKRRSFLIAQDVQSVLPEAVSQMRESPEDETEYLHIAYTDVIPLLVAAIKELKAEIDTLKGQA